MISLFNQTISPGATIGIIGGGQLGRYMAIAARHLGYKVAVLDPTPDSPCAQVSDYEIIAPFDDQEAIERLASMSDVITYEFENIDAKRLNWLEENVYLPQGSDLLTKTQDRELEKKAIQEAGVSVAPYEIVKKPEDIEDILEKLEFPAVIKTCLGGYDGKGQIVIRSTEDVPHAKKLSSDTRCVVEKWIPFEKEISVIVTRSTTGEVTTFPIAENIHQENILHQSIVPARIAKDIKEKAKAMALKLADHFQLVGTLAVEMFVTKEGDVFVNELAPRPHNSGHYTLDLCKVSQFEQHIRSICGLPLGQTDLLSEGVMVNLIGDQIHLIEKDRGLLVDGKLYDYGKKEVKPKRKMGHVTFYSREHMEKIEKHPIWKKDEALI
ncbi:5-(carboxyamino)imidazole ribonucleotide synthase [Bacillus carboniphilus]|uniref:N5-carboxyaminoimidazole ribonucleotide synthase n=1 Tax=Bacillus carboniphilus TaxID=86663 RepID=A0ABY9JUY7_9BACI|nr:5-(carboxyamino)imidazole ribonucleotide synthase [Bacillus carboniphilus]WLR42240.1 5-(carboxyamino)imidazole ribonucleotide synthase [Bacillus carboniphilus]